MGAEVVKQLIKRTDEQITVADANRKGLEKIARELGNRVNISVIDVNHFDHLVQLMKNANLVVSAVGPFYKYGVKVLEASIAAGVNFVDINDDFDATREALTHDEDAKKAGITALIGIGASPGVTNMLARYGANKLDSVDEIRIYWAESGVDPTGPAAVAHWFHITSGDIPIFSNGDWSQVRALSAPEAVEFLPPIGILDVYYTGHPEPITIPRYIKGVKEVSIKGSIFPVGFLMLYKVLAEAGFGSAKNFTVEEGTSMPLREVLVKIVRAIGHFNPAFLEAMSKEASESYHNLAGAIKVCVIGTKGGDKVQYIYDSIFNSVRVSTAAPAAIAVLMILGGNVQATGVLAPESALDANLFLSEMKKIAVIREIEIRARTIGNS
jgi:saccharopine dehydrogenase-like NADP-dependent oxidoreductase